MKKLKYKDLDSRLLAQFRERRSPPAESSNSSTPPEKFRREKVTFRRLQRQGERISDELLHNRRSSKWYRRFMKRHIASLILSIHSFVVQVHGLRQGDQWDVSHRKMFLISTRVLWHCLAIKRKDPLIMLTHPMTYQEISQAK